MLSTILSATGLLLGASALLLGLLAFHRTRTVVRDCRAAVHRLLNDAGGVDPRSLRDIAMVRYDALEEMSGARSFSLAMLNTAGDGVVLTSINGRSEARTYAKAVEGGEAAEPLSPEEYRVVRAARLGQGLGSPRWAADAFPAESAEPVPSADADHADAVGTGSAAPPKG